MSPKFYFENCDKTVILAFIRFGYEYDFWVQPNSWQKFAKPLSGQISWLFVTRIAEYLLVNTASSKARGSYSIIKVVKVKSCMPPQFPFPKWPMHLQHESSNRTLIFNLYQVSNSKANPETTQMLAQLAVFDANGTDCCQRHTCTPFTKGKLAAR